MKFKILLILFLSFNTILNAQQRKKFTSVDRSILSIPDSLTTSTQDIANYINSNFVSEQNKARAVFIWIAENIQYDMENMFSCNEGVDNIVNKTIETRIGVCQNYAELFHDITSKIGIKSYVVLGYTKDNGLVSHNPHAWCIARIDSCWYMFDPTWSAGLIKNSTYIKQLNDEYFKMNPEKSIKSHMPFDPLWQLSECPITNQEFCLGRKKSKINKNYFNYRDSLKTFEKQSNIERLTAIKKRIESNTINSYLIYTITQQLGKEIQNYYTDNVTNKYISAYNSYDEGIYLLNRFIDFRNNHFTPDKGDAYLKQMHVDIEDSFNLSTEYLDSIETPTPKTLALMNKLYKSIEAAMLNVNKQKVFLEKVLKTSKNYRKSLFYDKM